MSADGDRKPPDGAPSAITGRGSRPSLFHLGLVAAACFALAFAAAPWFAFRALRGAAEAHDVQALGELVDYGAVRTALRAQIRPTPQAQLPAPSIWEDPLGAMRRAVQAPILQPQVRVDNYLGPVQIARMAKGRPPMRAGGEPGPYPFPKIVYWDPNRCRIAVHDPTDAARRNVFTFKRLGLFEWKLVQIRLPETPP